MSPFPTRWASARSIASRGREGEESEDWIVVDVLRVVVHVFSREARARYDLESLWG